MEKKEKALLGEDREARSAALGANMRSSRSTCSPSWPVQACLRWCHRYDHQQETLVLDGHVMTEEEAQFFVSLVPVLACIHLGHASCDGRHGTSKGMCGHTAGIFVMNGARIPS